ncbi:glycosyltransferase family 4 protein [Nodosilinea sp. LEGE 07298]|uniref:glycosyltransferase family 4 protein n=1 Tax=Nodosilinea sp. LEGE 07298 TaxID=2777970 RepID=UPI00188108B3|nr:glycosyltransferase family 4 protein [Nodosilinea sp. LEGE 07298]MBE9113267.1 glycosyltransferase family 4 protein [Nodosilinea sp. LEGE 07298]
MRIAYVCADPGIPVFGQKGCSIHVQEVIRALRHQGATVELFAVRWGDDPPADLADVPCHAMPSVPKGDLALRETAALANNDHLRTALERAEPFDAVYERYSLWSYGAMDFAQAQGIAALLEVNAPLIEEQAQHRGLIQHEAARRVAERVFRRATTIIAVSDEVKQYLTGWVEGERMRVVPNGVNHRRFAGSPSSMPTSVTELRSSTFTVGFVGSLKPWHGLSHLVNAFDQLHQRVPEARLLIVGDGPERDTLEVQLVERQLQSVTRCTGAVPPDRIPDLLAEMDVAVAPYPASPDFYFSPLKVVEYMAAGLPVVVSDIGQLRHLVKNNVTGLRCPPGDENALALALERLWRSPDLRYALGRSARQHILAHHTWDGVAEQILAIVNPPPVGCIHAAMHRS